MLAAIERAASCNDAFDGPLLVACTELLMGLSLFRVIERDPCMTQAQAFPLAMNSLELKATFPLLLSPKPDAVGDRIWKVT